MKRKDSLFRSKYQLADCKMHFTYKIQISGRNFAINDSFKRSIGFLFSFFRKHRLVMEQFHLIHSFKMLINKFLPIFRFFRLLLWAMKSNALFDYFDKTIDRQNNTRSGQVAIEDNRFESYTIKLYALRSQCVVFFIFFVFFHFIGLARVFFIDDNK